MYAIYSRVFIFNHSNPPSSLSISNPKLLFFLTELFHNEIDWMVFETKIRKIMKDMLEPVYKKQMNERQLILELEKVDRRLEERLEGIEEIVHNVPGKKKSVNKSKFDEYDEKLLRFSTSLTE